MEYPLQGKSKEVRLFVSYAHSNSTWFKKLRPLLKFRKPNADVVHVWHDQQLEAGNRWHDEIQKALMTMDVFVCLVSYDFLASDYIMEVELKQALKQAKDGKVIIVPILLYEINMDNDCPELKQFNPLPAWGKCWREFERNGGEYQDAHKLIRDGLWEAIKRIETRGCKLKNCAPAQPKSLE